MRHIRSILWLPLAAGVLLSAPAAGRAAPFEGLRPLDAAAARTVQLAHDRGRRDDDRWERRRGDDRWRERRREERDWRRPGARGPIHHGRRRHVPPDRRRHHRGVVVVRPYGHWYHGYGHYHDDDDAFAWLAFTVITLAILDHLSEAQQRAHEEAQIRATTAPVGETIIWNQGGASGAVTATRDGMSTSGRYCREFRQEVTVGGKREQAYGTACQQPDGAWEIVSTGN